MYENKFSLGQEVVLFNSKTGEIEHDYVYGVLFVPIGATALDSAADIAPAIAEGKVTVAEQYQTTQHQIVDAEFLFATEEECKEYYRALFSE